MANKIRLLVVDDEADFLAPLTERLAHRDFDVDAYTNPVEALEETEGRHYDVGILDLQMPEMDGKELLHRLKERDDSMELIILTGHGSIESAFQAAQQGAYEYLLKPCDLDDLVGSINNAYAKRVKALGEEQARQVDDLMSRAGSFSPLDLLRRLKKIHHGLQKHLTAAALGEGGDFRGASDMMDEKSGQDGP